MEGGSGGSGRSLGLEPSSPVLRGEEPVEVRLLPRREGSMLRREGSLPKTNPTTTGEELQKRPSGESKRSAVQDATEPSTASQKLSVGHEAVVPKDQNGAQINNDPKAASTGNP
jgi:hypothetical protein